MTEAQARASKDAGKDAGKDAMVARLQKLIEAFPNTRLRWRRAPPTVAGGACGSSRTASGVSRISYR